MILHGYACQESLYRLFKKVRQLFSQTVIPQALDIGYWILKSQTEFAWGGHSNSKPATNASATGHSLVIASRSDQGALNMHQKHAFTLKATGIKQMHKAIATSQAIEPDASPSSKVVLAYLVVLYFESIDRSN